RAVDAELDRGELGLPAGPEIQVGALPALRDVLVARLHREEPDAAFELLAGLPFVAGEAEDLRLGELRARRARALQDRICLLDRFLLACRGRARAARLFATRERKDSIGRLLDRDRPRLEVEHEPHRFADGGRVRVRDTHRARDEYAGALEPRAV